MKFGLARANGLMSIDNVCLGIGLSSLAANISMVQWNGTSGYIIYNDRPGLNVPISDPSPYQPLIDTWLAAAETITPPLQLVQAQTIKSDLVDAIYDTNRKAPIAYTVNAGAFSWDCCDESVSALDMTLAAALAAAASTNVNSALSTIATSVTSAFTSLVGQINTFIGVLNSQGVSLTTGNFSPVLANVAGGQSVSGPTVSSPLLSLGTFQWTPIGNTTPVTLSSTEFAGLIGAILARRATLLGNRLSLKATLAATTTIAQVIATDITAGW